MSGSKKVTRGRGSKIEQLPDEVKGFLDARLRDREYSQQDILAEVNKQLEALGLEDEKISRSGLNRYSTKLAKIGQKMQERQQMANALTSKLGEVPQGDIGKLLINITQSLAFDILSDAAENDEPASLGMLKDLSLLVRRLESANMDSIKREKEIRKAVAEEAANTAEAVAKQAGLTAEAVATIKADILGIA